MPDKKSIGRDYPLSESPTPKPIQDTAPKLTMFDYGNIHTGDAKSHPGVLKAKSDKRKSDAAVAEYKSKMEKLRSEAILKAQKKQ
jgi:hypothetical protein